MPARSGSTWRTRSAPTGRCLPASPVLWIRNASATSGCTTATSWRKPGVTRGPMDNHRSFMQQDGFFAKNMEWIGSHDLDEKPGFKLALQVRDGRWFLYVTHIWEPGW